MLIINFNAILNLIFNWISIFFQNSLAKGSVISPRDQVERLVKGKGKEREREVEIEHVDGRGKKGKTLKS